MSAFLLRVYGVPAPAGSKTIVPTKAGPRVVDGGSRTARQARANWRTDVVHAARKALDEGAPCFAQGVPLVLDVTLLVSPPASLPKRRMSWPAKRPDLTKLLRATEDALTVAGVWHDDAQVVQICARKMYATADCPEPGAHIEVYPHAGYVDQQTLAVR